MSFTSAAYEVLTEIAQDLSTGLDRQGMAKYLIVGVLTLVFGSLAAAVLFPLLFVVVIPGSIICFMRAFTTKTCQAGRRDMPTKATICPSCHLSAASLT